MPGVVHGPADNLQIVPACFLQQAGRNQVAAHRELPCSNFDGFIQRVRNMPLEQQSSHQRRFDLADCGPNRGGAEGIIGTVQLILGQPENQPHRADLSKMLVHRRARRRGVGAALLRAAENVARDCGKSLLVLDTASGDAERLYAKLGWQRCGVIPGYALLPHGGLCDTTYFYRTLAPN